MKEANIWREIPIFADRALRETPVNKPAHARQIAYGANYSAGEYLLRFLWWLAIPAFRFSPRPLYGWRNLLLRLFGASIGKGVRIYPSARITFPWNLEIGARSVISWDVKIYNLGRICVGSDTIISQYAHLCAGNHDFRARDFRLLRVPITIGNAVWLAADVFVAPGVTVGDGCVVYARSVVIRDLPAYTLCAGHPARVLTNIGKS
jgi:putative colanic acid biosynthesis acetyltransferase WcaF